MTEEELRDLFTRRLVGRRITGIAFDYGPKVSRGEDGNEFLAGLTITLDDGTTLDSYGEFVRVTLPKESAP